VAGGITPYGGLDYLDLGFLIRNIMAIADLAGHITELRRCPRIVSQVSTTVRTARAKSVISMPAQDAWRQLRTEACTAAAENIKILGNRHSLGRS
jgi:hypothetical protein